MAGEAERKMAPTPALTVFTAYSEIHKTQAVMAITEKWTLLSGQGVESCFEVFFQRWSDGVSRWLCAYTLQDLQRGMAVT